MSDERLLPCPFCGGEAKVAHEYTEEWKLEYVMCFRCGCSTPSAISEDTVIQMWNTRKPMERIVERLEEEVEYQNEKANEAKEDVFEEKISESTVRISMRNCYKHAIEIVKGGGVNEVS